jgi:DNA-binding transcriptional LysR family regulator
MLRANLNDIMVFLAIADSGSFVGGGEALGLTRSAAGKAIGRLEERLAVRLFNRTTRSINLTDEGRTFYEHGLQIVASVEAAEASVAEHGGKPKGVLRLTVPDAFGRLVILPIIQQYLNQWPDVQVDVSLSDRVADLFDEGFDLAIRIGVTSTDNRLVSRIVAKYQAFLCAAPSYLERQGIPATIEELAAHDCLIFSSRTQRQTWRARIADGSWTKINGRSRLRLDSGAAIRDAAVAGLGIGMLPEFLVARELKDGQLVRLLPEAELDEVKIVTFYPTKRFLEPRVRRFIDLMVAQLAT